MDVNPTVCALAGLPAQENIDARSFGRVLEASADTHRDNTLTESLAGSGTVPTVPD